MLTVVTEKDYQEFGEKVEKIISEILASPSASFIKRVAVMRHVEAKLARLHEANVAGKNVSCILQYRWDTWVNLLDGIKRCLLFNGMHQNDTEEFRSWRECLEKLVHELPKLVVKPIKVEPGE